MIKCISFFKKAKKKKKKKYFIPNSIHPLMTKFLKLPSPTNNHTVDIYSKRENSNNSRKILTESYYSLTCIEIDKSLGFDRETHGWAWEKMDVVENFTDSSFYLRPLIIQAHSRDKFYHRRREGPACIKKLASYKGGRLSDEFIHDSSNFLIPGNRASW